MSNSGCKILVCAIPVVLTPVSASAASEAEGILSKVAEAYRDLRMYHLKVLNDIRIAEVEHWRANFDLIYKDAAHYYYSVHTKPSLGPLIVVRDGKTVWTFQPDLNEYIEERRSIAPPGDGTTSYGVSLFARQNARLVKRYCFLPQFSDSSKLIRREHLRFAGFDGDTILVEVKPPPTAPEQWTEHIWVDPARYLIVKSEVTRPSRYTADVSPSTFYYNFLSINETLPDDLFSFRPPPKARRVKKFTRRGSGEPPKMFDR